MKKRITIAALASLMAIAMLSIAATAAPDDRVVTSHDVEALEKSVGIKLKKPTETPAITEESAIEAAKTAFPGYASTAKSIKSEFQSVTKDFYLLTESAKDKNPKLKKDGYLNDTPSYIVTFKGVSKKASISGGYQEEGKSQEQRVFTDYHVVIDALTGEVLFSFGYGRR